MSGFPQEAAPTYLHSGACLFPPLPDFLWQLSGSNHTPFLSHKTLNHHTLVVATVFSPYFLCVILGKTLFGGEACGVWVLRKENRGPGECRKAFTGFISCSLPQLPLTNRYSKLWLTLQIIMIYVRHQLGSSKSSGWFHLTSPVKILRVLRWSLQSHKTN